MDIGVRELKAKLSEYLSKAAAGEAITVTDRGKPIARIVALGDGSAIARGVEDGWIEPAKATSLEPCERHSSSKSTTQLLADDRG